MREILFKAKRKDNGKWVIGYYQKRYDEIERERHYIFLCESNIVWEYAEIDKDTICQYTGLIDKNGNKIWENDIVRKVDSNALGYHRERICTVSFDRLGYWKIMTTFGDGYWIAEFDREQLEVIGNIFDNAELLQ